MEPGLPSAPVFTGGVDGLISICLFGSAADDAVIRSNTQKIEIRRREERGVATRGVANHLKRFWTPKMIGEIIGYSDSGQAGLNPAAARAVAALKQDIKPGR